MFFEELYREQILERYKRPHFKGTLDEPDAVYEDENPLCGDWVRVMLKRDAQGHLQARFEGQGCAISMASADLLMEYIQGRSLDEVRSLTKEDVFRLLGLQLSPARAKCALLPLKALKVAAYGLPDQPVVRT
ncbi:MAG: iron-sulfur cluster assembly scaffold protein [Chloroflexi bacterium]|nr:iron-sulfur cluster assembly scaffold protein [Chloroflexota bacterium]